MAPGTPNGAQVLGQHGHRIRGTFYDHPLAKPNHPMALGVDQLTPTHPDVLWHSAALNAG